MSDMTKATEQFASDLARGERKSLDRVVESLQERFPQAPLVSIERAVDRRYLEFYSAPIRDYIPLMVEREAKEDLRAQLGVAPGRPYRNEAL
jgi:hypothetical protein